MSRRSPHWRHVSHPRFIRDTKRIDTTVSAVSNEVRLHELRSPKTKIWINCFGFHHVGAQRSLRRCPALVAYPVRHFNSIKWNLSAKGHLNYNSSEAVQAHLIDIISDSLTTIQHSWSQLPLLSLLWRTENAPLMKWQEIMSHVKFLPNRNHYIKIANG